MATWSSIKDLAGGARGANDPQVYDSFTSDDSAYIYYIDSQSAYTGLNSLNVWQLDISDDSVAEIANSSFGSATHFLALIGFNSSVFALVIDGIPTSFNNAWVYEYSGSGTTWNLRDGPLTGGAFGHTAHIYRDDVRSQLVVVLSYWNAGEQNIVRYSTDGTTWNNGSVTGYQTPSSFTPTSIEGLSGKIDSKAPIVHTTANPIYIPIRRQVPFTRYIYDAFEWTGTQFSQLDYFEWNYGYVGGSYWVLDYRVTGMYHWSTNSARVSSKYSYQATATPDGTWVSPTDSRLVYTEEGFSGTTLAANSETGDNWLQFPSATNQWVDSTESLGTSRNLLKIIRFTGTGNCYAITSGSTPTYQITKRSEAFEAAAAASDGQFYQGSNSLAYKSDLPSGMTGVNRGALLVRQSGVVVVGSAVSNAVSIATASDADDFAAWTDFTDSHPTDGSITALIEAKR